VWPLSHKHREVEFDAAAGIYQNKVVNYNFPGRQLRYDITYLSGEKKLGTILNFTSFWLNDTLNMYTWETVLSKSPQCVSLDMGFGLMKPDWFITDANQSGLVWHSKKSDFYDPMYHRVLMSVKDAGQGGPADDEVFTYYSYFNNETDVGSENGMPFLMHAPSPNGMVVNEYYDFTPFTYDPEDTTFELPVSPACVPAGFAATPADSWRILQGFPGFENAPFTEIGLGGLNLRLPGALKY